MKPKIHVMLCDDIGERFLAKAPAACCTGLKRPAHCGRRHRPWGFLTPKRCAWSSGREKELGFALTRKTIGGRGGGGSTLTDEARNFMERYEAYRDACVQTDRELYYKFFPGER